MMLHPRLRISRPLTENRILAPKPQTVWPMIKYMQFDRHVVLLQSLREHQAVLERHCLIS